MKRFASVVLITCVALGWMAAPALADGSTPAKNGKPSSADDGRRSFGLQPAGPKGPDARAYYSYSVTPGAVVTDRMAVRNISARAATLTIYPADAFNTPQGGFDVAAKGVTNHDVGAWLRVRGTSTPFEITVPARTDIVVPISMKVPTNATPGDHAGGIVASLRTTAQSTDGSTVAVDQRVGIRVYTRVSGTLRPHLAVTQLAADFHGSPTGSRGWVGATWVVRNDGNVILGGRMQLRVAGLLGGAAVARRIPALAPLLPGESHRVTARVDDVLRTGRLSVTATVRPASLLGVVDPRLTSDSATVHVWAVPWLLVGVLLLVLLGAVIWWLRRRRGLETSPSSDGSGVVINLPASSKDRLSSRRPAMRVAFAALLAVGSVLAVPWPSSAAAGDGSLSFLPATGTDVTPPWLVTDAPCPEQATNLVAVATGHGFPRGGQVVVGNSTSWVNHDAPMVIGLGDSWKGFADVNSTELQGRYDVTLRCVDRLLTTSYATFEGAVRFTDAHHFTGPDVPAAVRDEVLAAEQPTGTLPSDGSKSGSDSSGSSQGESGGSSGGAPGPSTPAGSGANSPDASGGSSGAGTGGSASASPQAGGSAGSQAAAGAQPASADDSGISWLPVGAAMLGALLVGAGLLAWRRERAAR